ncbi:MAG: NAD(P)(+) transhydrogenase, partial [Planctomycetes bacterium SCN 63-9]
APDAAAEPPKEVVLQAETILIATGSSPVRPPMFPFEHIRVHDSDEILEMDRLPRTLAVVGAGVIGSEYACTFAALGVKVWMIDGRGELLPMLDADLSKALEASMREKLGITFLWNRRVTACEAPEHGDEVTLTIDDDPSQKLTVEGVLIAAGRSSNTQNLNLEAAGLVPGNRGLLVVDEHYRTSVPHIYAAGDVIGYPALASTSMEQARVAMCHACHVGLKLHVSSLLPTGIYTIPEASMVGASEEEVKKAGIPYVVGRASYAQSSRGEIIGDDTGFLKLIFRRDDMKLLGVHVLGEHATELVHIGVIAMQTDSTVELFNRACFNFPTLGDMYKSAAYNAIWTRNGEAEAATETMPERV